MRIGIIAATGRLGRIVTAKLAEQPTLVEMVAIGRNAGSLATLPKNVERRQADLTDRASLKQALLGIDRLASCANAVHLPAILDCRPDHLSRLVVMGSTRMFSAVPDATARAVQSADRMLSELDIPHALLLSTMIYGGGGGVVDGWASLLKRFPVLAVPSGPASSVQPIHIEDVAAAIVAALLRDEAPGVPIIIAGAEKLTQLQMVRRIGEATATRRHLLPLSATGLKVAAIGMGMIPAFKNRASSLGRMVEARDYDIAPMIERLGVTPRSFDPSYLRKI